MLRKPLGHEMGSYELGVETQPEQGPLTDGHISEGCAPSWPFTEPLPTFLTMTLHGG
jgi:hypothetical protein